MKIYPCSRCHFAFFAGVVIAILSGSAQASLVIADYRDDFKTNAPLTAGWSYLWNAPDGWAAGGTTGDMATGEFGDSSSYTALVDAGSSWTADGNTSGTDSAPDRYIRLSGSGGHPGWGETDNVANEVDRYPIAAYTVSTAGVYLITDSFLATGGSSSNGVEVAIHMKNSSGDQAIHSSRVAPPSLVNYAYDQPISFDTNLGYLEAGDTIYVGFGPNLDDGSDSFQMDFSIAIVPEPATTVGLLALLGVAGFRRRRRSQSAEPNS